MALPLHPFISGQPHRTKYLDLILSFIASRPDVWLTTSDEIARYYQLSYPAALPQHGNPIHQTDYRS